MNKKIKLGVVGVIALLGFSVVPFIPPHTALAQYVSPSCNSAVLNGSVQTNGATTTVWFEWGPNTSLLYGTPKQTFTSDGDFHQTISGLTENSLYSYRAMASNKYGTSTGQTLSFKTTTCTPVAQNPTVSLNANPTNILLGQSSTLTWSSNNATSCSSSWAGSVNLSGSSTVSPSSTTTYSITCYGASGTSPATAYATVNVSQVSQAPQPTVSLTADSTRIPAGSSTILRWSSQNATSCTASGGWSGSKGTSGSASTEPLYNTTTYSITCTNSVGSASASVTVSVFTTTV
ncbi:MAG: hypothetical protein ACREGC_03270, partial [Minisyncoccia bacterium]